MKLQNLMFIFIVVLLSASVLNTGNVIAVSSPNTNFETGDYFHYKSSENRFDYRTNILLMANDLDPSQLYRYDERYDEDNEKVEGDLELFLVKPGDNLPPFTSPDGDFDHLLMVDFEGVTIHPSNHTSWTKFYDLGAGGTWQNSTPQVDDRTGQHHSNDENEDENAMPVVSNATYLILLSEMTENTYNFDRLDNEKQYDNNLDFGAFDSNIPLTSRDVTTEVDRYYRINNVDHNIDTRIVRSTFDDLHNEGFSTSTNFGDPNGPGTPVDLTIDIGVVFTFEYYFDAATGMLLEIQETRDYDVSLTYFNASTTNPGSDTSCTIDCGPTTVLIESTITFGGSQTTSHIIDEASSFYGNTRPSSSGTNRIEEGDLLVYDSESENEFSFDGDMTVGDPTTTGWESFDSRWGWSDSYGTASFDAYRHQPGSWDAIMFMEGIREGEWGYDEEGTRQGEYRHDTNTSIQAPEDFLNFDYMSFQSTVSEEIVHFFDDNGYFNDDFLYDDRDDWRLNYDKSVPKSGPVNDSTFHIDLPADEIFQINAFDRSWFDVQMYGQKYVKSYNQAVDIPVSRDENGDVWMTVQLTGTAEGSQDWFYDDKTGVLIRMEQRMDVHLTLEGTQTVTINVHEEGKEPATISVNADFYADITIREKFAIMINEHPVEYLTAETTDPVDHSTPTTSTTSTSSTSTDDGGNGGDLPIPLPIVPVVSALSLIAIYTRKRR